MKSICIKLIIVVTFVSTTLFISCNSTEINEQNVGETVIEGDLLWLLDLVVNEPTIDVDLLWDEMTCDATILFTFEGVDEEFTAATNENLTPIFNDVFTDTGIVVDYEDIIIILVSYENDIGEIIELECKYDVLDYFEDCFFDEENDDDDDDDDFVFNNEYYIDCIDIVYPVTLHSYNSLNEEITSLTIENDTTLNDVFEEYSEHIFLEFQYPIQLITEEEVTLTIFDNDQLLDVLEEAEEECGRGCDD